MGDILWGDYINNLENVGPDVLGVMYTLALGGNWPKSVRDAIWEMGHKKDKQIFMRYYNRYKNKMYRNEDDQY